MGKFPYDPMEEAPIPPLGAWIIAVLFVVAMLLASAA